MLAQNFKTAEELGLTVEEHEALIKVLGVLERGEVEYVDTKGGLDPFIQPGEVCFNMSDWVYRVGSGPYNLCGTVCCIGGLAGEMFGVNIGPATYTALWLWTLCYPNGKGVKLSQITVDQAAQALRFCLRTGEAAPWQEIVGVK